MIWTSPSAQPLEDAPWKAKSVILALFLTIFGGVQWFRGERPPPPSPLQPRPAAVAKSGKAQPVQVAKPLAPTTPASLRFGASYIGGFVIAWGFRRFLRLTAALSATALAAIAGLKSLGWIDLDWASVEQHIHTSLAWTQGQAGAVRDFLNGYLPSVGAGGVGAVLGFFRRNRP